jgi:hypothetical protein
MTALMFENIAALPAQAQSLRMFLARLLRLLDALVSARAARSVPEWRMREVQREIHRHRGLIRAGELRLRKERTDSAAASNGAASLNLTESAICNFGR